MILGPCSGVPVLFYRNHFVLLSESDSCESCSYLGPGPCHSLHESQILTPCSLENHYFREKAYAMDTFDEPKRIAKKYAFF